MNGEKPNAAGGQGAPAGRGKLPPPAMSGIKPIHLFNVAGINVSLHPAWFLVLVYFIYIEKDKYVSPVWAGIECLGLFCIVLLHEFGHALACRSTGGKADRILLWPLGGVAYVQPPPRPGAFLWSIAAGPLVNVVLIPVTVFFLAWGSSQGWAREAPDLLLCARELAGINLLLLMFNMLPVYPLDGGQIVQSLLWFVIGRAYSLLVVSVIGFAAAVAAGLEALQHEVVRIPFTPIAISRIWCLLLAFYMIQRSVLAFKQARSMVRIEKMPRVEGFACPECREKPLAGDVWMCDQCQTQFNPFATDGVCPHCGKRHEKTRCPFCRELSEFERWRR